MDPFAFWWNGVDWASLNHRRMRHHDHGRSIPARRGIYLYHRRGQAGEGYPGPVADKRVVLFAVPGAFTPTCSNAHLPGYVVLADEFKAKGVELCCLSVNDAFVMKAWQEAQNASDITMLADGDGSWTRALGLAKETGAFGGGRHRSAWPNRASRDSPPGPSGPVSESG